MTESPFRAMSGNEVLRIEVIDDDKDTADSMAMLLLLRGHNVQAAYTGETALDLAIDWKPQIILLDIAMPGMNGLEVARKLRAQDSDATIIAMSGYTRDEDKCRAREAGIDYYVIKPFEFEEIQNLLVPKS